MPWHAGTEDLGCFAVGGRHPCCVDTQCGCPSPAVTEAASHGPQVDAGAEQLGRRVMPQCVNMRVDAQPVGHVLVSTGHTVR